MSYYPIPKRVKLCKDGVFHQFESFRDAAYFLWDKVINHSIQFSSVLQKLYEQARKGKPIYGYKIIKQRPYDDDTPTYYH